MLSAEWIAVLLTLLGGFGTGMILWGQLRQRVSDLEKARDEDRDTHKSEMDELKGRVAKAEEAATAVQGLALAVEHLGDKFGREVAHLGEIFGLEMKGLRGEFEGLRTEVRRRPRSNQPKGAQR